MKATIEYVERKFKEYNELMFGGRLPMIPVKLSDVKSYLGKCKYCIRVLADGRRECYNFEMLINTRIDLPENVVEDVIIHEMIHYFIQYNGLSDTSAHGAIFKSIMNSINSTFGRNICVTYKGMPNECFEAQGNNQLKWHVIAVMYFNDGNVGIKVLPRYESKIIDYYNKVITATNVNLVELYLHNNPFFNKYPTSTALKVYPIECDVLQDNLHNAEQYVVRNGRLHKVEE